VEFHKIDVQKSVVFDLTTHYTLNFKCRMGTVNVAILASTNPKVANEIHTQLSGSPPHKVEKRGLFSSIHDVLEKAVDKVIDVTEEAVDDVLEGVGDGVECAYVALS
jgi:hypothetical protein